MLYPATAITAYPRLPVSARRDTPVDVVRSAQVPVGMRLELVGDARAVRIAYRSAARPGIPVAGSRGGGSHSFVAYRRGARIAQQVVAAGDGMVELPLSGDPDHPVVVYPPDALQPVITEIVGVGGEVRPAPRQPRWLASGDAVTQGWLASSPSMAWPAVAARKLGLDLCNLGYAGASGALDPAVARRLADTPAEVVSLAVGHGVWDQAPHTPALLAEALRACVAVLRAAQPGTVLVVISPTLWPDAEKAPNRVGATLAELRRAAEEAAAALVSAGDDRLFVVPGAEVFGAGHLADGVFPDDEGHKRLAAAVGKFLAPRRDQLRQAMVVRRQEEVLAAAPALALNPAPPPARVPLLGLGTEPPAAGLGGGGPAAAGLGGGGPAAAGLGGGGPAAAGLGGGGPAAAGLGGGGTWPLGGALAGAEPYHDGDLDLDELGGIDLAPAGGLAWDEPLGVGPPSGGDLGPADLLGTDSGCDGAVVLTTATAAELSSQLADAPPVAAADAVPYLEAGALDLVPAPAAGPASPAPAPAAPVSLEQLRSVAATVAELKDVTEKQAEAVAQLAELQALAAQLRR